jgi:hypothetical protein
MTSTEKPPEERCSRWPRREDTGRYRVACSCGEWEFTGTAAEIVDAEKRHVYGPHVVTVRARKAS